MRKLLAIGAAGLALTVAAFGADNSLGTWKLSIAKSNYSPAPFPYKSLTVVRAAADGGAKVTLTGERFDGAPVNINYIVKYDGTPVTVVGQANYDTLSVKQVNADTFTDDRTKVGGKHHVTGRTVISNGGKTMTVTLKGVNRDGAPVVGSMVYEKQ